MKNENKQETTIITYEQIEKMNEILVPQLTMKMLRIFWKKWSVGERLSTSGLRKLVLNCFNLKDPENWKGRTSYSGKPKYPFWELPINVQAQILSIMKTHPEGKRIAEDIENHVSNPSIM